MNKTMGIIWIMIFLLMVSACSKREQILKQEELKRIDVQDRNNNKELIITDPETIHIIKHSIDHVKRRPDIQPEMARPEDFTITLFHLFDKNMPERLYLYKIWFNPDDTATIINDNSTQGYGTLEKEYSEALEGALLKHGDVKKLEEIIVHKLDKETKQIVISGESAIKTMKKAIESAVRVPGIVDMADPQFKINIGDDLYFLWLNKSEESIGTIMNFHDTHTVYTLSKTMTKELQDILLTDK